MTLKQMSDKIGEDKKIWLISWTCLIRNCGRISKAQWHVIMIYSVGDRLLKGIKIIYVDGKNSGEWMI